MVCITFLAVAFGKHQEYQIDVQFLQKKLDILFDYQSDIIAKPLWNVDEQRVQKLIEGLNNDPDVAGSAVFDDNFSTFGSSGIFKNYTYDQVKRFIQEVEGSESEHHFTRHIFQHIWNTKDKNSLEQGLHIEKKAIYFSTDAESLRIGTMFIVLTERYRSQQFVEKLLQDLLKIIVVTICYLLTTMVLYAQITSKPLKKLMLTIRDIRAGKEAYQVGWQSKNEIGQVITEFEKMQVQQLELKNQLQASNDDLSVHIEKLKQRTREKTELEYRLLQAQKLEAIGNLAGGIAHDFNNLLYPIVGMSELLLEDLTPGSYEYENAQEILKAGLRGSDLVKQILTFSRHSVKKKVPIRVSPILREVIRLCRSTIPADIEIHHDIQQDCRLVMADPTQIHQIALNLMTNAYHAVEDEGGKIYIRLKEVTGQALNSATFSQHVEGCLLLSVSDTGTGISSVDIDQIFEPYFTTKKQGKGTGLGLAIVFGIVKDHGGDIQVESEHGTGTTFTVYLPTIHKDLECEASESPAISLSGTEHILLVDDEKPVVFLGKQILERLGYTVASRVSGADALALFRAKPNAFDLVITDMAMPGMTGDQLAKEMLAIRPEIPIIMLTGYSDKIDEEKATNLGIKGFLIKPAIKSEMAAMVRKVLDNWRG